MSAERRTRCSGSTGSTPTTAQIHILEDLDLVVDEGELVCLLGGNASGKSTTLKTILGLVQPRNGTVEFRGEDITGVRRAIGSTGDGDRPGEPPAVRADDGAREPGDGRLPERDGKGRKADFDASTRCSRCCYERRSQLAGTLSGGEQQMVAMGRALMSRPSSCSWTSRRWGSPPCSSSGASRSSRK